MKSTLVARIFGGLGNQLFIYAYARASTIRTGSQLRIDIKTGFYRDIYQRNYNLHYFNIPKSIEANTMLSLDYPGGRYIRYLLRQPFSKFLPFVRYLNETNNKSFEPSYILSPIRGTLWVEGYWQTPQYFQDIRPTLVKELSITAPLSETTKAIGLRINQCNAVCLHARRLRNSIVGEDKALIKSLSLNYYYKSIEHIKKHVDNPIFFCFSDDTEWLKQHLNIGATTVYVTHNKTDESVYEDFWLMQQCKHFVISNSTFSWWPAWLSEHIDKVIVAPEKKFWDNQDILPSEWHVIAD